MGKNIIIIGGGVAGLTAGIYAQQNSFHSIIIEQNAVAGGLCSYWERNGFHIDNCVHWLFGTKAGSSLHRLWKNVRVLTSDDQIFRFSFFSQVELDGQVIHLWRDINTLKQEMLTISPQDKSAIEHFIKLLKVFGDVIFPCDKPFEQFSLITKLKILWQLRCALFYKIIYSRVSLFSYAKKFKHPIIQKFITSYFPRFYNVASMLFVYGNYCSGNADLPSDGSRGMIQRMTSRYLELGGEIKYNSKVTSLTISQNKVEGVQLENGNMLHADIVLATCDLYYTMNLLLKKNNIDRYMREHFVINKHLYPTYSSINVYFACDSEQAILPGSTIVDTDGLLIFGKQSDSLLVKDFNYEPSFSPNNKSLIQIIINQYEDDAQLWINLRMTDKKKYREEKERIAQFVMYLLEKRYAPFKDQLHLLDITTPATNHRFCSVYKGAYMSFALTPYNKEMRHRGRVKDIDNMYLAGQWLHAPGGLPSAAITGKFAIQRICHQYNLPFIEEDVE